MKELHIEQAKATDLPAIRALLVKFSLPANDVEDHLQNFCVAKRHNTIIGVAGLEIVGKAALLRSVAVQATEQGKGIARLLCRALFSQARHAGIGEVALLTTTAESYFERLGFKKIPSKNIPAYVKKTKEYRLFCPSNAVCMVKRMSAERRVNGEG